MEAVTCQVPLESPLAPLSCCCWFGAHEKPAELEGDLEDDLASGAVPPAKKSHSKRERSPSLYLPDLTGQWIGSTGSQGFPQEDPSFFLASLSNSKEHPVHALLLLSQITNSSRKEDVAEESLICVKG